MRIIVNKKYLTSFLVYLDKELNYSDHTIKNYELDILKFFDYLKKSNNNITSISKVEVRNYLKLLHEDNLSNKSISRHVSSLRSFYFFLLDIYVVKDNPFLSISNPKLSKKLPNYLNTEEIDKLFLSFNDMDFFDIRNHLLLELIYSTGLRVSEALNIKIPDIDLSSKEIIVMGKGSKERVVLFGDTALSLLKKYLKKYRSNYAKSNNKYLFISKNGNQLSVSMVRKIIETQSLKAGIKRKFSVHDLRHTFASDLINNGASIETVQKLLGHSSLASTQIYTHITSDKIKSTYLKTHPRNRKM
ncbi:MAG: site-specific tyrosine recombinase/integron integrase [bacterium]